ncbi:hypothetical protein EGW08_008306 [Elysia chlorotica]|uniref:RNase H type-1 domain-containing protein n=1 Tax=Elysia chlorotica TaxID=188477 RepID=A0A3S1BAT6_ELYCH|nr:hypothetical protein EGW08_008306 [Elysia chlorotica]
MDNSTTAAELAAIDEALKTIQEKKMERENIVILTDSLAATLSIKNTNKTNARQDLTESINIRANDLQEKNQTQVQICWIPAHCNIEGNEKADQQAKLGLSSKTRRKTGLGPSEVKSIINQYKNKKWQDMWTNNPKGRFFHAIAPQKPQLEGGSGPDRMKPGILTTPKPTLATGQYVKRRCGFTVGFTETWFEPCTPDQSVKIDGFTLLRGDRTSQSGKARGGGVCLYINERWAHSNNITMRDKQCTTHCSHTTIFPASRIH